MKKNQVDTLIRNALVYNSYFKEFVQANVWVLDGKFYYIDEQRSECLQARQIIDAGGKWLVPGLIDIHTHIESSMLTPLAFSMHLAKCGVTTIVSEPHEMANVNGMEGILDMLRAGEGSPIDIFYGIPSCVPASSPELETTGGQITCTEMEELLNNPAVVCVGEVMSYRQIIKPNQLEITKFLNKLRQTDQIFPIEGHCPALLDLELAKFLYLGINGDHTEHSLEELRQRFAGGMFMEIQDKMLCNEVLDFIMENGLCEHFCFVTDDVMADTLYKEGHLDGLVRKAIGLGMAPEQVIYNATYTPSRRMNLLDRGAVAPGKLADFLLLDDLNSFSVAATYKQGRCIFSKEGQGEKAIEYKGFPKHYYHSIRLPRQEADVFTIHVDEDMDSVWVRVMDIQDGSTKTTEQIVSMPVENGVLQWEKTGYLLAAVFERYGKGGGVGYGFLTGDCHKHGAVATSYAHDCHNILVAGNNPLDMQQALNRVIQLQGGMVVVDQGLVQAELQLNVGGILSDRSVEEVGRGLGKIREAMIKQGYRHYNPIMSFGTLTLTASPALKLTDKGLIDVPNTQIVPLIVKVDS